MTFRKESILQCHVSEKRTRQQVWKWLLVSLIQWRGQPKILGGIFDFRRAQYFCLGRLFSKHKI